MIKVLHIIPNFNVVGGAEMMLARLIVSRPDCQHVVVALIHDIDDTFAEAVQACHACYSLHWNGVNTLRVVAKLRKIIQQYQPNIIQSWLYHANVLAALSLKGLKHSAKLVWGIHHSLNALQDESLNTRIALKMSKSLCRYADAVVYCAHSALQQHQSYGLKHQKSVVIVNGIDLSHFIFNHQLYNAGERDFIVGFAGRYHAAKGYDYLFETIQLLQHLPIKFYIAGKGAQLDNPEIQQLMQRYQISPERVKYFGHVDDMVSFYQQLDVLLLTSITEGLPTVLIEAMACGVVCIATDVGDSAFIVHDCGTVVAPRQPTALRDAVLQQMSLSVAQQQQLKTQARQWIEQTFALSQVSAKYLALWQSLLASESING